MFNIYVGGSFDMFHVGHLNILRKAKQYGRLIVGVSSDELIESYKGSKPIIPFEQRIEIIKAIKGVDKVVKQTRLFHIDDLRKLKINYFVLGDDWKKKHNKRLKYLIKQGLVLFIPYTKGISSTMIKEQVRK